MKKQTATALISISLLLGACGAKKESASASDVDVPVLQAKPMIKGGEEAQAMLNASVVRLSGDFAGNVAVTLNQDGTLAYYPDPSDLTAQSSLLPLGDGWYLNRQGIGPNSVFTSYTFDDYRALKTPPTHQQLLASIIPGAVVTEFMELPISASEAIANPKLCLQYLK